LDRSDGTAVQRDRMHGECPLGQQRRFVGRDVGGELDHIDVEVDHDHLAVGSTVSDGCTEHHDGQLSPRRPGMR
jgi:hypothetical protein